MPNRPSRRARVARLLLVLTTLATLALASVGTASAAHEFTPGSYSASGGGTTSVGAHNTGVHFSYNQSGMNGSWSFTATADQTGPLTFDWVYGFFHSWFQANGNLTVFANGPTGQTSTMLVNTSGGQSVGTATIDLTAGYTYGFNISGSNFDFSQILQGNLYIFPDTDVTAPVVTPTVTGTLGDNGWYVSDVGVTWSVVENETMVYSQGGCETQTVNTDTAGTSFTCTATSFGGTTASTVTIMRDTAAPVISVSGATTVSATQVGGAYVDVSVTVSDIDPAATVVCDPALDSLFPIGTTDVTCTANDAAGFSAIETFSITVVDDTAPVLTVPADIVVSNDAGLAGAAVSFEVTATDYSGDVAVVCAPVSGSFFGLGTTTVDCTATDPSENVGSDSFTVTVNDTENPVLTVPANISVSNDDGAEGAVVTFEATATDNSGSVTVECAPASGTFFNLGTTTVDCSATDASGNTDSGSGSFTVTVTDSVAPVLSLPANIVVSNDLGQPGAVVSFSATATDNSGSATVECAPVSGTFFALGTTTVDCSATDSSGNSASGSFSVTVNDTEAPILSVPGNIVVPADSPDGTIVTFDATATDNSGSVTVACVPASGSLFPNGTTTVMCTATDPTGNTATGSFTVTVDNDVALINALKAQVLATMPPSYYRSQLVSYLDQALLWESRGQDQRAAMYIDQFIDRVTMYRGTVIDKMLADDFIAQAEQIMAALGHSGAPDPRK